MKIYRTLAGCTFAIVSALIVVGEEQRSYPETEKNDVVLAQATASQLQIPTPPPSSGSTVRGASPSGSGGFSPEGLNPPASSSATARLSDMDLSGRTSPRQSPRSLSQFSSANRGSTAFRPPNIFGDFFGGQSDRLTLLIPVSYSNAPASNLGPNAFGFDVAGSSVLDIFSQGLPSSQGVYSIAEPLNPTAAYIPTNDGLTGYQFNDGTATPTNINQSNFDIEYSYSTSVNAPNSLTGLYGRQKIAENVSPIPQNRLFLNYSYFNETRLDNGLDVKRWSPGFESLVGSEWTSFEMRLPMATTLSSNIFNDVTDRTSSEVGNLYLALKQMMYRGEDSAISIGMSMTLPTADDLNIFVRSSTFGVRKILEIDNQSVHIHFPSSDGTAGVIDSSLKALRNSIWTLMAILSRTIRISIKPSLSILGRYKMSTSSTSTCKADIDSMKCHPTRRLEAALRLQSLRSFTGIDRSVRKMRSSILTG
jgi:hypothetical protein